MGGIDGALLNAGAVNAPPAVNRNDTQNHSAGVDYERMGQAMFEAYTAAMDSRADMFSPRVEVNIDDDAIVRSNMRGTNRYGYQMTREPVR